MDFLLVPFKLIWSFAAIVMPVLGLWLASSLAAFLNGPTWVAVVAGALMFPIIPLVWEWRAGVRFARRMARRKEGGKKTRAAYLTFWDRFVARTLVVNLVFVASLLASFPEQSFLALSTRGDWMLVGKDDSHSETVRRVLFTGASGLEWLYNLVRENPFEKYVPDGQEDIDPAPNPIPLPFPDKDPDLDKGGQDQQPPGGDTRTDPVAGQTNSWPMKAELHPLVANMPKAEEKSIETVAKYILRNEPDERMRIKALNDYVADRVAYDAKALAEGRYPPQDAETVFRTGRAVCAGYAKLMVELAKHTGDNVVYVVGVSRQQVRGRGHAWNAAQIDGDWFLIDTTWNAGHVKGATFTKKYTTDYLFTPPKVFGINHFPDDEKWQLRADPIDRGTFVRQPLLKAGFFANGLTLKSPNRPQIGVSGDRMVIKLDNPLGRKLLGTIEPKEGGESERCDVDEGVDAEIVCPVASEGTFRVVMYATDKGRSYPAVGQLEVIR